MSDEERGNEQDESSPSEWDADIEADGVTGDLDEMADDDDGDESQDEDDSGGDDEAAAEESPPAADGDPLLEVPPGEPMSVPGDFKENWSLLFCCIAMFIACLWLPMEAKVLNLTAAHSVAGGFLLVFAGYGIVASIANIVYRKMIMWPVLFAAFDGLYVSIKRIIQLVGQIEDDFTKDDYLHLAGAGTWVILFCSMLVFWTLFGSVMAGRKRDIERREQARAAKAAARKR